MDPLIAYFQAHPLIALGLALLVGLILGSIVRKLLRLAFWLGLHFPRRALLYKQGGPGRMARESGYVARAGCGIVEEGRRAGQEVRRGRPG